MTVFNPDSFKEALDQYEEQLAADLIPRYLRRTRQFLQGVLVRNRLSGPPGLSSRSSTLRRSFRMSPEGGTGGMSLKDFTLTEFSTAVSAPLHEYGGVVIPKRGKYLAIPLPAAQTATGVKRGGPRTYANTFARKTKIGNLIIFQRNGDKKPTPLFLLVKTARIPPRLNFKLEWDANQDLRLQDVATSVDLTLAQLGK